MATQTTDRTNEVATEILRQLGGGTFIVFTGARAFGVEDSGALRFQLPPGTRNGANLVRIRLDPSDTYTIEFHRITGVASTELIESLDDVYVEDLQDVFTRATGLYTRFGQRV
jgi:hypothetical protein